MANKTINRRLPFNTELLEYGRMELGVGNQSEPQEFDRALIAAPVGFAFILRAIGLAAPEWRDITFGQDDEGEYVRSFIRKSKTGREEVGVFRSLNATGERLCPYNQLKRWADSKKNMAENALVFGDGILSLVTKLIKWTVRDHRRPIRSIFDTFSEVRRRYVSVSFGRRLVVY